MGDQAAEHCPGQEEFFNYYIPTKESWNLGDRTITCLEELY